MRVGWREGGVAAGGVGGWGEVARHCIEWWREKLVRWKGTDDGSGREISGGGFSLKPDLASKSASCYLLAIWSFW